MYMGLKTSWHKLLSLKRAVLIRSRLAVVRMVSSLGRHSFEMAYLALFWAVF